MLQVVGPESLQRHCFFWLQFTRAPQLVRGCQAGSRSLLASSGWLASAGRLRAILSTTLCGDASEVSAGPVNVSPSLELLGRSPARTQGLQRGGNSQGLRIHSDLAAPLPQEAEGSGRWPLQTCRPREGRAWGQQPGWLLASSFLLYFSNSFHKILLTD